MGFGVRNILYEQLGMIQYKFGAAKSPSNHYVRLKNLRLSDWHRADLKEKVEQSPRTPGNKNSLREKTPLRWRRDDADSIQHYYSTKNLHIVAAQKQLQKPQRTMTPLRPRSKKLHSVVQHNRSKEGTRSVPRFQKHNTQKTKQLRPQRHQSTLRLSKYLAQKAGVAISDYSDPNQQIQRMAKEINKLKDQNSRLTNMYKKIKILKDNEEKKIKNYQVLVEQKNVELKKRINNLNAELRQLKPNQMIIFHIETYPKINPEAFSPALVQNRIDEITQSLQQSAERAIQFSKNSILQLNTETCESPPSRYMKKDDTDLSDLSLQSQKSPFQPYDL